GVDHGADQVARQRLSIACREGQIDWEARFGDANSAGGAYVSLTCSGAELGDAQGGAAALHPGDDAGQVKAAGKILHLAAGKLCGSGDIRSACCASDGGVQRHLAADLPAARCKDWVQQAEIQRAVGAQIEWASDAEWCPAGDSQSSGAGSDSDIQ